MVVIMPIPSPNQNEDKQKFISRCMGNNTMQKEYPDSKQRAAICIGQTNKSKNSLLNNVLEILGFSIGYNDCDDCGFVEEIALSDIIIPESNEYIDMEEEVEIIDLSDLDSDAKYKYMDPKTFELFYYDRMGNYKKDERYLVYQGKASEYQGRKVTLNKPFRTPGGPKKMSVYVKNEKGNVVKVNFGDPNMKIKKNIPSRRKSFRARHNCDNPGPKWKARYWSCKAW